MRALRLVRGDETEEALPAACAQELRRMLLGRSYDRHWLRLDDDAGLVFVEQDGSVRPVVWAVGSPGGSAAREGAHDGETEARV